MTKKFPTPRLRLLEGSVSRFRDLVNTPRRHHALVQRQRDFVLACSAMDILDDTILALNSYVKRDHQDQGLAYLEIFGVLQALSVQQDAVTKLYRIITGKPINLEALYPDIKEVREIRVRVAGHPVGGKAASHFMVRYTVSKRGFELWAYDQTGGRTVAHVDLFDLIMKNSVALQAVLEDLASQMENEDKAHKAAFAHQRLADIFKTATYCSGKLFEGVTSKDPIGKVGSRCLRSIVKQFKEALVERSEHFVKSGFLSHDIPILEHAIDRYDEFIDSDPPQNEYDGYILARYIQWR